jgi:hypothetical protein
VHNVNSVGQAEMLTVDRLVLNPTSIAVESAVTPLNKYKSPGSDQIPAELIQVGGEILLSAIHKLMNSVWNKEELPD